MTLRNLAPAALFFAFIGCHAAFAECGSYNHCRQITFFHTKAGLADTAQYAALVSGTYPYLATVSNGGAIQHTVAQTGGSGLTVPSDMILADVTCSTRIAGWEFEAYNPMTGAITLHANIGTLTHLSDLSTVYLCYGNASVSTWQGSVAGTWDNHYKFVAHMADHQAGTTIVDSTINGNHAVNQSATSTRTAPGKISAALNFPSALDWAQTSGPISLSGPATLSTWIKLSNLTGYGRILEMDFSTAYALTLNAGGSTYSAYVGGFATGGGITDNSTWHYIVQTYDGLSIVLYVDGVQVGTVAASSPGATSRILYITTWNANPGAYGAQGLYDEIRISNVARSASQILAEFNNQSDPASFYSIGADLQTATLPPSVVRRRIL